MRNRWQWKAWGVCAGNGSDAAMQKAMAASLRDIQEHEERVRKQAQQAQRETMGPNGEPVQPQGGTLACVPSSKPLKPLGYKPHMHEPSTSKGQLFGAFAARRHACSHLPASKSVQKVHQFGCSQSAFRIVWRIVLLVLVAPCAVVRRRETETPRMFRFSCVQQGCLQGEGTAGTKAGWLGWQCCRQACQACWRSEGA